MPSVSQLTSLEAFIREYKKDSVSNMYVVVVGKHDAIIKDAVDRLEHPDLEVGIYELDLSQHKAMKTPRQWSELEEHEVLLHCYDGDGTAVDHRCSETLSEIVVDVNNDDSLLHIHTFTP
ncbi:hypothetical protein IWW57_000600 [Coemansia sp. S610]|nr:hypothetical protein IWW57_000600 [Coemansia sp. S610]